MQDKVAILEAELADYKRKEEAQSLEPEEKKDGYVQESEFNDVKMKLDEAKMQLQTIDLERKQLQVRCCFCSLGPDELVVYERNGLLI